MQKGSDFKRVFIGIKAQDLQPEICEFRKKYSKLSNLRWISEENLHITLIPPWNEANVDDVVKLLSRKKICIKPFMIKFEKVCFGPSPNSPRLVWAVGKAPKEILYLKKSLETLLKKSSSKDYKLHLTLARFRESEFRNFEIKSINERVFWTMDVSSFVLFESILTNSGSFYRPLLEIKL